MADQHHDALWRKNIPADFDGRHGKEWDDEVDVGIVYKSAVAVVVAVAVAFGFCWLLLGGFAAFTDEPVISPISEVQDRHLPPSPQLEPDPVRQLTELRATAASESHDYGWSDQLTGRVHIPVDKAMDLVLSGGRLQAAAGAAPADPPADSAGGSHPGAADRSNLPAADPHAVPASGVPVAPPAHGSGH
jgi:hypothetical protein